MGFDFKEMSKGGWHPKGKDGSSKESWRGDFKGIDQISGWMNKGKGAVGMGGGEAAKESESTHMVTPLRSLRDPATFAPPPKRTGTFGGVPPSGNPVAGTSSNEYARPGSVQPQPELEPEVEKPPPQPYRRDTTGLSTSHLPPPPGRRDGADGRMPSPAAPAAYGRAPVPAPVPAPAPAPTPKPKPKPSLPPRLPPRQTENPNEHTPAPPPPYSVTHEPEPPAHQGILNQNSMNRLGAAGVSVPGFGIAPSPSPPLPTRRATQPPPLAAKPNTSQLGELQSRFNTSHSTQQAEQPAQPSQGTTWAQKQAALKTASSFQRDPSSISFSDARNAASTANNFRERHGAQVASGLKSANKLNSKYGLTGKAAAYGMGNKAPEQDSGIVMRDNSGQPSHPSAISGKQAPPPPPKKRPELLGTRQSSGGPPPIPHASKPKPPMQGKPAPQPSGRPPAGPPSTSRQQDLNLDLQSEWYAAQLPHWPPQTIKKIPGVRALGYTNGWSAAGARKTCTFTGILTTADLGRTKIRVTWDAAAPKLTAKGEQVHIPPPQPLGQQELERCQRVYGERLAAWCEGQMGNKVGNGECWTLANDGLKAVAEECKVRGEEPCMTSQSLVHGVQVYSFISPNPPSHPSVLAAGVRRGDLIQFWTARFENEHGWKTAGMPDHTSVVANVRSDGVMEVLEQNTGGVKIVKRGEYDLGTLTEGEVRVFRPVGVSWLGDMNPSWP